MASPVIVVDYDAEWPTWFERYRDELVGVDRGHFAQIEHVGSTSVVGLAAKPVIDVMVGVADPALLATSGEPEVRFGDGQDVEPAGPGPHVAMVRSLRGLGYRYRGESGIPGRLLFGHRVTTPPCHVHVARLGGDFWTRHLLFRDYLRAHPEAAAAYAALKRDLAARFRDDRQQYTEAKTDFILACEREAERWRRGGGASPQG